MNKKFWTELWFFMLFLMAGFVIVALLTIGFASAFPSTADNILYYHIIQWLQTIFVMMLPAMAWCKWRTYEPYSQALRTYQSAKWQHYMLVIVVSLLTLPLLDLLSEACRNIPLPEALRQMAEEESSTQEVLLNKMLDVSGFGGWTEIILLMSIATAIGEELTFRGALLTIFRRYSGFNKHVVAILVGLIFSAIHFDFYGLIPRWILGTVFVYLVYYTGCIWPSVLAHALNNLYALLQYKGVMDFG